MAQELIEVLDQLPELELQKIRTELTNINIKTVDIDFPKKGIYLFGHIVNATPIEIQEMELMVKMQTIEDWKGAKEIILAKLEKEGVKPAAIVPTRVFNKVIEALRLIDLKEINPENGNLVVNPLSIDSKLLQTFIAGWIEVTGNQNTFGSHIQWILNEPFSKANYSKALMKLNNDDLPRLEYPDRSAKQLDLGNIVFQLNVEDFYSKLFIQKDPNQVELAFENMKMEFEKESAKMKDSHYVYDLIHNQFNEISKSQDEEKQYIYYQATHSFFHGTIIFPPLPDEFQKLLITLRTKFPAWPVYTAADPEYFRISYLGIDIHEYAKQRSIFWGNILKELHSEYPNRKSQSDKLNEKLKEELAKINRVSSKSYVLLSNADLQKAIDAEKDPIFYVSMKQIYKNIEYDITVVWGQTGDSPNEKAAIEKLKAFNHTVFLGSQMN